MNEDDLKRCDELMSQRDHALLNHHVQATHLALADEVPGLVAEVRRLNLQLSDALTLIEELLDGGPDCDCEADHVCGWPKVKQRAEGMLAKARERVAPNRIEGPPNKDRAQVRWDNEEAQDHQKRMNEETEPHP